LWSATLEGLCQVGAGVWRAEDGLLSGGRLWNTCVWEASGLWSIPGSVFSFGFLVFCCNILYYERARSANMTQLFGLRGVVFVGKSLSSSTPQSTRYICSSKVQHPRFFPRPTLPSSKAHQLRVFLPWTHTSLDFCPVPPSSHFRPTHAHK